MGSGTLIYTRFNAFRYDGACARENVVVLTLVRMYRSRNLIDHAMISLLRAPALPFMPTQPENVFVGEDGCLKIGDFGLSRPDCEKSLPPSAGEAQHDVAKAAAADAAGIIVPRHVTDSCANDHTTGVGTASYASPEQLQGRRYGLRSDMFSLGLMLLELCCCFTTTHERAAAFQSMRNPDGAAPLHLAERAPEIAALAELLCRTTVEHRPSAAGALERLDRIIEHCGCARCNTIPIGGGAVRESVRGGGYESDESGDSRLREELAAKTRIVEEQVLI